MLGRLDLARAEKELLTVTFWRVQATINIVCGCGPVTLS
jgi:hypothetical protein